MLPERWEQICEIYHSALEMSEGEQKAFVARACAGNEFLLREVESLLAANAEAGDFIAEPVFRDVSPLPKTDGETFLSGKKIAHYRILSRIGAGGMGEVYLAKDTRLDRKVALKTLPASLSAHPNYLRRFETEARAAATLNHPNVATVYSVEETNGQPFFTMEYVEGKTLDAFISAGGLDLKTFLEWFVQIADALARAHEKDIVHRDIKPGNIMITEEGVPKILDFGLAQIGKAQPVEDVSTIKMTLPGQVFGTPSYMSPEQAEGKEVDVCSDIFSFGVVMYEAITGTRPFQGDSYAAIINELLMKQPKPVSEIRPEIPFLLSRLIMRCLDKNRRKRFQSMREVRVILEEIEAALDAGISLESASIPALSKGKRFLRRSLFIPLTAILIVAAALALQRYFREDASAPPLHFGNMTPRKLSQTNNVVYAQITPDGKSVAYNTIEPDEKRSLWIRRVEDKNALQLLAPQPVFFWGGLTISHDGSQIYYITAERAAQHGTLYRISSLGGAPRKLVETVNDLGSLSPDGERVLYVRYGEQMQLLSANSADGSGERVIHTGETNHIFRDPHFSRDGKQIFFIKFERIRGEEFWSLVEIPANGGQERVIVPARKPRISEIAVLKDGKGLLMNATDTVSNLPQLFHVSIADGKETRVTNDLNAYFGISVSDDAATVVTAQRSFAKDIWIYPASENAHEERKLSTESNIYSNAVWTPDGRIVYDAVDNNRPQIWIMNGDGSDAQQLTSGNSFDYEPQVSPDGRFIVFTSDRSGERKIWRMNIDGSSPQLLAPAEGVGYAPVITPDGRTVLFSWRKQSQRVLGKVPLGGGETLEQKPFSETLSAISPDGRQVAFAFYDEREKSYKVGVRPFDADEPTNIFNVAPANFLLWKADGKGLLYRALESSPESIYTIWLQPIAGGEPKSFLSVKPDSVFNVSLSKDGKQAAVVRGKLLSDAVMFTKVRSD
jgi:serine/threonine protein kinase/WD40 repeat protein